MRRNGHKYGAVRTEVDGITFASKAEARRYGELKLLEKAGEIRHLTLQPRFALTVRGEDVGTYIADFDYWTTRRGFAVRITEDVKGVKTPIYRLKKKLMQAIYGITITEVR